MAKEIIVLGGPKGGTGTTTLAIALAKRIHKKSGFRVALVDLDAPWGNVAVQMQLPLTRSIYDLDADPDYINLDRLIEVMAEKDGIFVLGINHSEHWKPPELRMELVRKVIGNLARFFDVVVVDTGKNLDPHTMEAYRQATQLIGVMTPNVTDTHDVGIWLKKLNFCEVDAPRLVHGELSVVINKVTGHEEIKPRDIESSLRKDFEIKHLWTVPFSGDVSMEANRGKVSRELIRFADSMAMDLLVLPEKKKGFFKRLLGA